MDDRNCQHLLAHLSDYIDGEASSAICAELEAHTANCADCQVVVDTLRQTVELYQILPRPEMSEELRKRLYSSLDLSQFFVAKD